MLKIKDSRILFGLGGLTLTVGLIMERFVPGSLNINFVVGIMIGMSLVFNVKALMMWRAERVRKQ